MYFVPYAVDPAISAEQNLPQRLAEPEQFLMIEGKGILAGKFFFPGAAVKESTGQRNICEICACCSTMDPLPPILNKDALSNVEVIRPNHSFEITGYGIGCERRQIFIPGAHFTETSLKSSSGEAIPDALLSWEGKNVWVVDTQKLKQFLRKTK